MRVCILHVVVISQLQELWNADEVKMYVGAVSHELPHEHEPDTYEHISKYTMFCKYI